MSEREMENQQKYMHWFNYNFHDILKIKSNVDLGTPFFEVDDVEPDLIVMVVNDFEVPKSNSMIVLGKNYWCEYNKSYIYYDVRMLKQRFKLYLSNINNHE
jgi:phosphoribosyl 1,2-cyclic phosphodiesterase